MASNGRYPKTQSRTRHRSLGWTVLAPDPGVPVPPLPSPPSGRGSWSPETIAWWQGLWRAPQAQMWDPSGFTLEPAARLHEAIVRGAPSKGLEAELRQHYDRHGLSPKSLLQLRWTIGEPEDQEQAPRAPRPRKDARRRRLLRAVDDRQP